MYQKILVAIDNSSHSRLAAGRGIDLARRLGASLVGCHVYAARLHDQRFRQMEGGLPEKYQEPQELQRQRTTHDSLITQGLRLISESYLEALRIQAEGAGIPFSCRTMEGKNYLEIIREARDEGCDLVMLGALGLGAVLRSLVGSVCERVVRGSSGDVWVARGSDPLQAGIVVAVDGSPWAMSGIKIAASLAGPFDAPLTAVAAYDPYFHQAAFKGIAGVLSEEAGRLFHFQDQERLHGEIIDRGMERVYQSYLQAARKGVEEEGLPLDTVLLCGKPFEQVLRFVEDRRPALLVVGRLGSHWIEGLDIGSTAENLARLAPCDVLVVGRPLGDTYIGALVADRSSG